MLNLKRTKIILLAITACLLWSSAFAFIKIGLDYCAPILFAGTRFILAGILLLPFCGGAKKYFKSVGKNFKAVVILSFFQTFLLYSLFFWGMTLIPGSTGAIVTGSSPLIAAIAAHVFLKDDKLTLRKMFCIFSGIFGIILISFESQFTSAGSFKELLGILILLAATFASSIGNVIVAVDKSDMSPIALNSAQIGLGGFMLLILSFVLEGYPQVAITKQFVLALLWLSFISSAGFSIWFYLIKKERVKVSELNMWKFIIPIFGALISWMLLKNDTPSVMSVIGMLIVSLSVLFFFIKNPSLVE
jgi:drug/metabolite transporter (DMT)-like permease